MSSTALSARLNPASATSKNPRHEKLKIPGFEVIFARRAHFILPDGTLDKPKWERIKLHGTDDD
jgi:hypothetical protein